MWNAGKRKKETIKVYPYYTLVNADFIEKHKRIGINWGMQSNEVGLV